MVLAWLDSGGQGMTYLPEFCIHLYSSDFPDMEKKIVKIITVIRIGSYASSLIRFFGIWSIGIVKQNRGEQGFQ